jgi:cytochrome b involved in lipid metabolism
MFLKETAKRGALVENPDSISYTWEQIAEHKTEDDCWTAYEGRIYDVTEYAKVHPGGKKIFLGAGKDCTEIFNKYHPWINCHFMIAKY